MNYTILGLLLSHINQHSPYLCSSINAYAKQFSFKNLKITSSFSPLFASYSFDKNRINVKDSSFSMFIGKVFQIEKENFQTRFLAKKFESGMTINEDSEFDSCYFYKCSLSTTKANVTFISCFFNECGDASTPNSYSLYLGDAVFSKCLFEKTNRQIAGSNIALDQSRIILSDFHLEYLSIKIKLPGIKADSMKFTSSNFTNNTGSLLFDGSHNFESGCLAFQNVYVTYNDISDNLFQVGYDFILTDSIIYKNNAEYHISIKVESNNISLNVKNSYIFINDQNSFYDNSRLDKINSFNLIGCQINFEIKEEYGINSENITITNEDSDDILPIPSRKYFEYKMIEDTIVQFGY